MWGFNQFLYCKKDLESHLKRSELVRLHCSHGLRESRCGRRRYCGGGDCGARRRRRRTQVPAHGDCGSGRRRHRDWNCAAAPVEGPGRGRGGEGRVPQLIDEAGRGTERAVVAAAAAAAARDLPRVPGGRVRHDLRLYRVCCSRGGSLLVVVPRSVGARAPVSMLHRVLALTFDAVEEKLGDGLPGDECKLVRNLQVGTFSKRFSRQSGDFS